jgi:hypothetical protein
MPPFLLPVPSQQSLCLGVAHVFGKTLIKSLAITFDHREDLEIIDGQLLTTLKIVKRSERFGGISRRQ